MRRVYGPKRVAESNNRRPNGRWVGLQRRQRDAESWMGHMSFGLHTILPGGDTIPYFTVVREPVRRELSRFRSMPQLRFKNRLTPVTAIDPEWGAVYQLSGIPLDDIAELGPQHVELALKNLHEHFAFIGDTSRMEEVGLWFRRDLCWPVELPLPHENPSGTEVEVTEEEIEELREHPQVKLDQMLYQRICELGPHPKEWRL
jgi:hypothetical protein